MMIKTNIIENNNTKTKLGKLRKSISFSKYYSNELIPKITSPRKEELIITPRKTTPCLKEEIVSISNSIDQNSIDYLRKLLKKCKNNIESLIITSQSYEKNFGVILIYSDEKSEYKIDVVNCTPSNSINPDKEKCLRLIEMLFPVNESRTSLPNINKFIWSHNFYDCYNCKVINNSLQVY